MLFVPELAVLLQSMEAMVVDLPLVGTVVIILAIIVLWWRTFGHKDASPKSKNARFCLVVSFGPWSLAK